MEKFFKQRFNIGSIIIINQKILQDTSVIINFLNKITVENLINGEDIEEFKYIGEGRSGIVYKFANYCIKIFKKDLKSSDKKYWYVENDAKILNSIQDINLYPDLYGYINDSVVIMQYIEGLTLEDFKNGHFNSVLKEDIIEKLLNGMKETLQKGIFPMDIHEGNIIIDDKGGIHCIDVGCFKLCGIKDEEINKYLNKFRLFEDDINIILITIRGILNIQKLQQQQIA